ncbi:hypothetical protein ACFF45_08995 [Streptomyces cinereospinus]|uniref:Uncharacterized protein n=1 Tax=Streptomyces cinereospinus TaxID=285561 RepID=A0ABV5MXV7_9ACTN
MGRTGPHTVRRCVAAGSPAAWVTADGARGQGWNVRRLLEQLGFGYVVTGPKSRSLAGF